MEPDKQVAALKAIENLKTEQVNGSLTLHFHKGTVAKLELTKYL